MLTPQTIRLIVSVASDRNVDIKDLLSPYFLPDCSVSLAEGVEYRPAHLNTTARKPESALRAYYYIVKLTIRLIVSLASDRDVDIKDLLSPYFLPDCSVSLAEGVDYRPAHLNTTARKPKNRRAS
ncbi:hypothetical protein C8R46DRAFT_1231862 [Mycena filopes]|nr:hypothetical protein C8R46DRAFT_1231862 [Mycena filopes]